MPGQLGPVTPKFPATALMDEIHTQRTHCYFNFNDYKAACLVTTCTNIGMLHAVVEYSSGTLRYWCFCV